MKIGVSSYSFAQYLKDGRLDRISILQKAADLGFEAIEYTDLPEDKTENRHALARQIREEAARIGLELSAYVCGGSLYCEYDPLCDSDLSCGIFPHGSRLPKAAQAEVDRLKGELDIASILGVKLFRYDVTRKLPPHKSFESVLAAVTPAMRQLADYGETLGIMTMIENHGYAFQDYDRIEKTFSAVDHDNFGLLLDTGNFLCADQDNVFCTSRLAHLTRHVHVKDFLIYDYGSDHPANGCFKTRACNWLLGTAAGFGHAKTAQCLSILKDAGYDGYVDIEFEGPEDCLEELKKGLAFIQGCLH